ncbi:hypothetical protein AGMMS50293_13890 [Spirochaetia bacterium]|nr:hypothetical protein AGMMS50293_13890 [Spirochaetia bacterium]
MEPSYQFYFKNNFRPLSSLSLHEVAGFECPGGGGGGYVLPLEKPDAYAIYGVLAGRGVYTLSGTEYTAEKGEFFALYPGLPVVCRADRQTPHWTTSPTIFRALLRSTTLQATSV